jgi:hypothetical protein
MDINKGDTAVVFIDPQNDVSDKGLAWALGWRQCQGEQYGREHGAEHKLHETQPGRR